jgi:hypothetical protein
VIGVKKFKLISIPIRCVPVRIDMDKIAAMKQYYNEVVPDRLALN